MTKPKKAVKAVTASKRKLKETLFPMVKATGEVLETPADKNIADSVVSQCAAYIELLRKIGRDARIDAIKKIAKLLDSVSPSTNTAVFLREKPQEPSPDLFAEAPKTDDSLFG